MSRRPRSNVAFETGPPRIIGSTFHRDPPATFATRQTANLPLGESRQMESFFLDETRRLRTVWRFAVFGISYLTIQTLVGVPVVVGLLVYLTGKGVRLDSFIRDPHFLDDWQVPIQIAAAIPMTLCDLGLVIFCRRYLDQRSVASLGFVAPGRSFFNSVPGGLLLGGLPIVGVIGILLALGWLTFEGVSGSVQTALLVPTLIFMGFNEEILCRGYLLQNLVDVRRPVFGIFLSSAIFWILHALNPAAWSSPLISLNLFGAGITLALAYRVSGNIWFPSAMHFAWNFAQGVLFEVPISGLATDGLIDVRLVESAPVWLTGGSFGIEGSILATGAELVMSSLLGFALLNRHPPAPVASMESVPISADSSSIFLPDDGTD